MLVDKRQILSTDNIYLVFCSSIEVRPVTNKWVGIYGKLEEGYSMFVSSWFISLLQFLSQLLISR